MVNFGRFPHILKYSITPGSPESVKDENGDWIVNPEVPEQKEVICRATPNGDGSTTKGENGDKIIFDFLIYAPPGITDLDQKMIISFYFGETLLGSGVVQRIDKGSRKNTRIWV